MRVIYSLALILFLTACVPSMMMREQPRVGLTGWVAGAAAKGYLPVVFYGTSDASFQEAAITAMDGRNVGPVVALTKSDDFAKGARVIVVMDPAQNVYGDFLCSNPKDGFSQDVKADTRVGLAFCYSDQLYSHVVTRYLKGRIEPGNEDFTDFFGMAFEHLTDPHHDRIEAMGNCSNPNVCG